MLRVKASPSITYVPSRAVPAARASMPKVCCAANAPRTPSLAERALTSPHERVRQWGITELVRVHPDDGAKDALRCSTLTRFVREHGSVDHHALLDAIDMYGASPRMLPLFKELLMRGSEPVRLRAAPRWGALIGLYRVTAGYRDTLEVE